MHDRVKVGSKCPVTDGRVKYRPQTYTKNPRIFILIQLYIYMHIIRKHKHAKM